MCQLNVNTGGVIDFKQMTNTVIFLEMTASGSKAKEDRKGRDDMSLARQVFCRVPFQKGFLSHTRFPKRDLEAS